MNTKSKPNDKMRKAAAKKACGSAIRVRDSASGNFVRTPVTRPGGTTVTRRGTTTVPAGVRRSNSVISDDRLSFDENDQLNWRKRMNELTFGQTIRAYRLAEEWSLNETAAKIGISKQQLSDYEHGRKLPSIEQADRIAKALDMMPEGLILLIFNEQLNRAKFSIKVKLAS